MTPTPPDGKLLTGYFDRHGRAIREGDLLSVGMRRGDSGGWSHGERVVWLPWSKEWGLRNARGETMQFQYDQQLRELAPQGEKPR